MRIPQTFILEKSLEEKVKELSLPRIQDNKKEETSEGSNSCVEYYVKHIKLDWKEVLSDHGYVFIEEDLTDEGLWHENLRSLGKVAFWRRDISCGVIVRRVQFYDHYGALTYGTGVYMTEKAYEHFKKQGYKDNVKEEKLMVNGKEFNLIKVFDIMKFYDFLK